MNEDEANAHAGMPFCGVSRFVVPTFWLVTCNSPLGAWVVCVYRSWALQSLKVVNASTHAFFYLYKNGTAFCRTGLTPEMSMMEVAMSLKKYLLLVSLFLVACSNPYYKFYRGDRYERDYQKSCEYLGSISSADEIRKFLDDGYSVMGESGFSSTKNDYSVNNMIAACNAVGGDAAVIVEPEYLGTENVMRTYYTYQPGQTYTVNSTSQVSGGYSGDVYGRYDRVGSYNGTYNGTGSTQTTVRSEGRLEAHPYMSTADKYAYRAVYLKRTVPKRRNVYDSRPKRRSGISKCYGQDEDRIVPDKEMCFGIYPFGQGYVYWDEKKEKCRTFSLDNVIPYCKSNQPNSFLKGYDPYEFYLDANRFMQDSVLLYMQYVYHWAGFINSNDKEILPFVKKQYGHILLWEWLKRMNVSKLYEDWVDMDIHKKMSVLNNFYSQIEERERLSNSKKDEDENDYDDE